MDETKQQEHRNGYGIDLTEIARVILNHKALIVRTVAVVVILTAIVSLVVTPTYKSQTVIAPVETPAAQSGLAGLATQFGITSPQSSNALEIMGLLNSDILMQKVMEGGDFFSTLFEKDDFKGKTENEKTWEGIRMLKKILDVKQNKKENNITISAECRDPVIARNIVNATLSELTEYMTAEAKRVADTNRKYLEAQIVNTGDPLVRQKIYSLIAQQIETIMMAEAKENFAFKMIDPPRVPDKKIRPKRILMVVMAFVVALLLSVFAVFVREHYERNRGAWRELATLSGLKRSSRKG